MRVNKIKKGQVRKLREVVKMLNATGDKPNRKRHAKEFFAEVIINSL